MSSIHQDVHTSDDAIELLQGLEQNVPSEIKRARTSTRVRIKSKVIAQPGNSGDRLRFKVQGVTGDVSGGGCQVLFPIPMQVGDIYWLTFDQADLNIGSLFARCLRCRLIREDAYEAGFKFFETIELSDVTQSSARPPKGSSDALFD